MALEANGQPAAPTFIVGTARPEIADAAHPLHTVLLHLRSDGCMTELTLPPLDNAATASFGQPDHRVCVDLHTG
ncbi:MAG: hypothetical protein R2911_38075 [Caldilineaceae bacterium]